MLIKMTGIAPQARDIKGRFDRLSTKLRAGYEKGMRQILHIIVTEMRNEAPKDTGGLRLGIREEIRSTRDTFQGRITSRAPHTPWVIKGTRPHWAPIDSLAPWAKRHGLNPYALQRRMAGEAKGQRGGTSLWALMKYGTMGNPFHKRAIAKLGGRNNIRAALRDVGLNAIRTAQQR